MFTLAGIVDRNQVDVTRASKCKRCKQRVHLNSGIASALEVPGKASSSIIRAIQWREERNEALKRA